MSQINPLKWRTFADLPEELQTHHKEGKQSRIEQSPRCPYPVRSQRRIAWSVGYWESDAEIRFNEGKKARNL